VLHGGHEVCTRCGIFCIIQVRDGGIDFPDRQPFDWNKLQTVRNYYINHSESGQAIQQALYYYFCTSRLPLAETAVLSFGSVNAWPEVRMKVFHPVPPTILQHRSGDGTPRNQ